MKRFGIVLLTILLVLFGSYSSYASLIFTEEFDNTANIQRTTMTIINGVAEIGYPDVHGWVNWNNQWGDYAYYNGNFYIVWTDGRYDGQWQVFLTKINTNGSILFSTNVEVSMHAVTNSNYYNFARIPTISVYDSDHIYISFLQFLNGKYYTYTSRWRDLGSSLELIWSRRVDNGYGDNISYTPIPFKLSSAVGDSKELYLVQVWHRIGSGELSFVSKILPNGTQMWLSPGSPGTQYLTVFNGGSFIIAGEAIYRDGFIYASGQHWIWSPNRDFGVGINKISTNDVYSAQWSTGTNITTDRGIILNYARHFAPKVSMTILGSSLYVALADQRNGDMDVFLAKVNTNNGAREWTKLISGGSGDQEYPSVSYDSVGNLYVSYVDRSSGIPILYLAKVDKDTGEVKGRMNFNSVLYANSGGFYLPDFYIDSIGAIYIFFKEDGGVGKVRVKVAKFDEFGGNLVWLRELPDIQFKKYSHILSRRLLQNLVGTPVAVRVNSTYSGAPTFRVSPNGGINYYLAPTNQTVEFTNLGNDLRVRVEAIGNGNQLVVVSNYTFEILFYYTGDLFASTNSLFTTYVGSNFISPSPTVQLLTNITFSDGISKAIYYVKLHNTGNTNGQFYLYLTPSGWPVSVYNWANVNVSTAFTNGEYSIIVPTNSTTNFRIEVSIPSTASDREFQDFSLYSSAIQGGYLHDSITLRAISWKYLPDAFISNVSGISGTNLWEISPITQVFSNLVNSKFAGYETVVTNYIVIENKGILQDVVLVTNRFYTTLGSISDWNIVISNITDGQSVSFPYHLQIPSGQRKVIQVTVSAKTNAPVGSFLNLEFFSFSTNTRYTISGDTNVYYDDLRKDSIRLVFENHKYQPDLIVATNPYFLGGVQDNNYVSTNISLTQSIMVRTVNDRSLTYYFKLQNDGEEVDIIHLRSFGITNSGWSEVYYLGSDDITLSITNGTNIALGVGEEFVFRGVFTPDSTVESGVEPWVKLLAYTTNFTNAYDVVYARPRNIKVKPDAMVGYDISSATNGNNVYNSTGANQYITNVMLKGGVEVRTNVVIVQNDSTTDPDIINIVGDKASGSWFIKYLDLSDNDITHNITNTSNLTLPLGSSVTLKVVSYPLATAGDDEWIEIKIRAYSSYVNSQEDVVVISNRAVSIKPDMGVFSFISGWIDIPTISTTYLGQASLSNKIVAGRTNNVKIRLKNDTDSLQEYTLKASLSNIGGSLADWNYRFRVIVGNTTNDITAYVTNLGWIKLYSAREQVEVLVEVTLTNAVENNLQTTNGAVSNTLEIRYDFVSMLRTNTVDRGMHSFIAVRGLPDAYHDSIGGYAGIDIITNTFVSENYFLYGLTLRYPREDIILRFKNDGDFRDVFRIYATVSNGNQPGNHITNWIFRFYDEKNNDITSLVTNTNAGWTNLITNGYEKLLRVLIVNTNGFVNDEVFFFFYFETITLQRRLDTVWFGSVITPGLPDIAISNITTGILRGTNQFAPDSFDYQKTEANEIGRFKLVLRNIAPVEGEPEFRLKATFYGDVSKFEVYHTNKSGEFVSNELLTSSGYTNSIRNYNSANGWPEDNIYVYVKPKNTAISGDLVVIRYEFSLYDNPGVFDVVYITNKVVKPRVSVMSRPSIESTVTAEIRKYQSSSGSFVVSNADNVWEEFVLRASQSNPEGWVVSFFTNSTDISSYIFGSGFTTPRIEGSGIVLFSFRVTNTTELVSGTTNIVTIRAISKKNTNVYSVLRVEIVYVDAIADIFALGSDEDNKDSAGKGILDGAITNKIELNQTNVYTIFLSNSIGVGDKVRFIVSVESNHSPNFTTRILSENGDDITGVVFTSNYVVELRAGESKHIKVYRVLTNTNSLVCSGFYSYLRLSMKTYDIENNIYDFVILRDVVVDPRVDLRSASGYDNIFSFTSYSDAGKVVKTFKNVPVTLYLGIMNVDAVAERFFVKANVGGNIWDVKYYDCSDAEITEQVSNGNYLTPEIQPSQFYFIKAVIKPSLQASPADVFEQFIEVWSLKNTNRKDYVTNKVGIESMFIVGSVKDRKTKVGISGPIIEVTDPYGVKVTVTGDESGNYSAPVYPVIGGLYKMKVDARGYVGSVSNIYLEIGTNVVNFELVSFNMVADKVDVRIFPNPIEGGKGGNFVYAVSEPSIVTISIYDINGKLVRHLVKDERKEKGVYYVLWDGTDESGAYLRQGVYIFTINTGKEVIVKKLFVK
ncbi:MAG: T9SS type A sorting domain-containing protein [Brevinematia bacterium]